LPGRAFKPTGADHVREPDATRMTIVPLGREALAHADALYNHARRLTRNAPDADELVQETYARALAAAHTFMGGYLKAWLFKIMRNTFIDLHRRGRHQPALSELDVIDGTAYLASQREDRQLSHLPRVLVSEIETALGTLSEEARSIILLDLEGFTEGEVAEVLGCPVGTVKSRLSRARALLRECLKDYAPPAARAGDTGQGQGQGDV
jgi:RNA polymerase sigma-70 factor (ECF subfamily)